MSPALAADTECPQPFVDGRRGPDASSVLLRWLFSQPLFAWRVRAPISLLVLARVLLVAPLRRLVDPSSSCKRASEHPADVNQGRVVARWKRGFSKRILR